MGTSSTPETTTPSHPRGVVTPSPTHPASAPVVDVNGWKSGIVKPGVLGKAILEKEDGKRWNTKNLGLRLGVDAMAAGAAGVLVAPVILMIDRGIIENASGRNTLGVSLRNSLSTLLLRPHRFFFSKPFALIYTLYFGTYLTANTIDTLHSTTHNAPPSTTTPTTTKFLLTSAANLSLCLHKDRHFTRLFSPVTPKPIPLPTLLLFTARDTLTIFSSFNLPPLLAPKLQPYLSSEVQKYMSAASVAQFVTPAAVQVVSTPLHLLGLDLYNRAGVSWGERMKRVGRDWGMSCAARMGRIVPAFGVGGVVNQGVRGWGMGVVEGGVEER